MVVEIAPTEIADKHWVNLKLDGAAMEPRGPFSRAGEAEAAACQIAATCRGLKVQVIWDVPAAAAERRHRDRHP